jgi:cysteine desulfurase/selenocysteine lyase
MQKLANPSTPRLNPQALRADFPILDRRIAGKDLIYLDNAASSQKPASVIAALDNYYENTHSNVHRGIHHLSQLATDAYEQARVKVANLIGAADPAELVWVRGATEGLNLVAQAWARPRLGPGDEVLVTNIEHHSNIVPWQLACEQTGATLRWYSLQDHRQRPEPAEFATLISERTKVVALTAMSNVLGVTLDIAELARLAHAVGAVLVVDGAQSVPNQPVDVVAQDIDFLAFSGHKMLGPTGIGGLYGKRELLEEAEPYQGGGDMIATVAMERSTWNRLPYKFEAGTPDISGAIGLGVAADYLSAIGLQAIWEHEQRLTEHALAGLAQISDLQIYGPTDSRFRGGVVSFNLEGLHPHDLGQFLDSEGIAVRAGHHCAQPLMGALGVGSTTRASFYIYNTEDEIDALCAGICNAREYFG